MNRRPLSITIIGWIFILVGCVAFLYHVTEIDPRRPLEPDLLWVCFVRILALISGVFLLRGCNWARWLLVVWIAFHVVLSAFHSLFEVTVHACLLAVVTFFLFRRPASAYFGAAKSESPGPS